jgi:hypothetical protein
MDNKISYSADASAQVEKYLSQNLWHAYCIPVDTTTTQPFGSIHLGMKWYDEPDHGYKWVVDPAMDSLLDRKMLGYFVYSDAGVTSNSTISVTGKLNTGPISFPMTATPGPDGPDGWNLAGNPYPSAIDWLSASFTINRVDPTIYVFHPETGNYYFWNRNDQLHTTNASSIIASQQGFYMHSNAVFPDIGSISLDNSARLHSGVPFYKPDTLSYMHLYFTARGNNFRDETQVRFDSTATVLFDPAHDAYKLWGSEDAPQFYSILPDSTKVTLNTLPWNGLTTVIPMGFHIGVAGTDTLGVSNLQSFSPDIPIWLEDLKTNTWTLLTEMPEYIFTTSPGDDYNRFLLHFSDTLNSIRTLLPESLRVYSWKDLLFIDTQNATGSGGSVFLYDLAGKVVFRDQLACGRISRFRPGLTKGLYLVRATCGRAAFSGKVFLE